MRGRGQGWAGGKEGFPQSLCVRTASGGGRHPPLWERSPDTRLWVRLPCTIWCPPPGAFFCCSSPSLPTPKLLLQVRDAAEAPPAPQLSLFCVSAGSGVFPEQKRTLRLREGRGVLGRHGGSENGKKRVGDANVLASCVSSWQSGRGALKSARLGKSGSWSYRRMLLSPGPLTS